MNHPPYDSWMFEVNNLTNQQKKELYEHLRSCPACSSLQNNWEEFHTAATSLPVLAPAEGFTQRWRKTARVKKELQARNQVKRFFIELLIASGLSLSSSLIYMLSTQSFFEWVLVLFTNGIRVLLQSGKVLQALITWFGVIPPAYPITIGFLLVGIFGVLSVIWFYIFVVYVCGRGVKSYEKIR